MNFLNLLNNIPESFLSNQNCSQDIDKCIHYLTLTKLAKKLPGPKEIVHKRNGIWWTDKRGLCILITCKYLSLIYIQHGWWDTHNLGYIRSKHSQYSRWIKDQEISRNFVSFVLFALLCVVKSSESIFRNTLCHRCPLFTLTTNHNNGGESCDQHSFPEV